MILAANPRDWPEIERYLWAERAAIKMDSGIAETTAERDAEREIRAMVEGKQVQGSMFGDGRDYEEG